MLGYRKKNKFDSKNFTFTNRTYCHDFHVLNCIFVPYYFTIYTAGLALHITYIRTYARLKISGISKETLEQTLREKLEAEYVEVIDTSG